MATERAIEKLVRSYEGKVSRLLDVCRQSLIFESAESLAACLHQIAADPDISCLSVRNRFHESYDANHISLGYRDVNLNVRLTSDACRRLGLDQHVCEIQLILKDFAAVKLERGHKRYVAFRNARGQ